MTEYKGYTIKEYETMGIGTGLWLEAWKNNKMMAFARTEEAIKGLIDILENENNS